MNYAQHWVRQALAPIRRLTHKVQAALGPSVLEPLGCEPGVRTSVRTSRLFTTPETSA